MTQITENANLLSIKNIEVIYDHVILVLKGVSLDVPEGSIVALLGGNGAGKSTTIGVISSLVNKTEGKVEVFGYDIDTHLEAAKAHLGLVPQEFNFSQFETLTQILVNQAGYYGVPRSEAHKRADKYLAQLGLLEKKDKQARTLSGGMKRRLMIARALMHEPKLLILDEPTAALGVKEGRRVLDLLQDVKERGISIVLISHNMPHVFEVSDRIHIHRLGKRLTVISPKDYSMADAVAFMTGAALPPELESGPTS